MTRSAHRRWLIAPALVAGLVWACSDAAPGAATTPQRAAGATTPGPHRITGPHAHQNLTVFLIHGADRVTGLGLLTLEEAIEQKKIVVHETGDVNQLAVENLSSDLDIYIPSGDIVKGGRQDRMIAQDLLVSPRSGKVSLGSFCVEQGRWSGRGKESAAAFESAKDHVVGNAIKLAARKDADQGEVWKQVEVAQLKLGRSLGGAPIAPPASSSSLQLTLEDDRVNETADGYVKALSPAPAGRPGIVGCAFAVNGRVTGAEIYASSSLFRKMWPKLLKSAAIEALAERPESGATGSVSAADVRSFLAGADRAAGERRDLNPRVRLVTREAEQVLLFETLDRQQGDAWIHRSYVAR